MTVLYAEDDLMVRELLCAKLSVNQFRVVEAASGDEALPLLRGGGIEVLITDISMPGTLDGWALAEQARQFDPDIGVVYVSSGPADAQRQVGNSVYLRKPFHPDAVLAAVRQLKSRASEAGEELNP